MGGGRSALSGVLMLQCLDLLQDDEELVTECGKTIFDMGRNLLELGFAQNAMCDELAQPLIENLGGDPGDGFLKLARPCGTRMHGPQDTPSPLATKNVFEQCRDAIGRWLTRGFHTHCFVR